MNTFASSFRQTARRTTQQFTALGEAPVLATFETDCGDNLSKALIDLRRLVEAGAEDARASWDALVRLGRSLSDFERVARFTAEGWPERRAFLSREFTTDTERGMRTWFAEVVAAAARRRSGAVRRLCEEDLDLPAGMASLAERCRTLARGLEDGRLELVEPLLGAVLDSPSDGLIEPSHLGDAAILLSRLALHSGSLERAEAWLARSEELGAPRDMYDAARAWLERSRSTSEPPTSDASSILSSWGQSIDLAVEAMHRACQEGASSPLSVRAIATDVAYAQSSLVDIEVEIDRLIEPAPVELWLAVAERARQDGDLELSERCLDRAVGFDSSPEIQVAADDLRATIAADRSDTAGRVARLKSAGQTLVTSGRLEEARRRYQQAQELDERDDELVLLQAEVEANQAAELSVFREAVARAGAARALIAEVRTRQITDALSWGYLLDAWLCDTMSSEMSPRKWSFLWDALESSLLGVVHNPTRSDRWAVLCGATLDLQLHSCARAALDVARGLSELPLKGDLLTMSVIRAANAGDADETLRLVDAVEDSPWRRAVESFVHLTEGRYQQAAASIPGDDDATDVRAWQVNQRLMALALWDLKEAENYAATVVSRARSPEHDGDAGWASSAVLALLVLDRVDEAVELARRIAGSLNVSTPPPDNDSSSELGAALLLQGRSFEGTAALIEDVGQRVTLRALRRWFSVDRPLLERLAARKGVALPELPQVDAAADHRRQQLLARQDPIVELEKYERLGRDEPRARALLGLLGRVIQAARSGDGAPLIDVVSNDEHLRVSSAERAEIARNAPEMFGRAHRRIAGAEFAAQVVAACRGAARESALGALRRLIDCDANDADVRLGEACSTDSDRAAVLDVLAQLRHDDDTYAERTAFVTRWFGPASAAKGETPAAPIVRLELPASWFDAVSDAEKQHPIFVQYLPAARVNKPELPSVRVRADAELEPDGYRIKHDDDLVETGTAAADRRYLTYEAVALLSPELRRLATPGGPGGRWSIPADAVGRDGAVAAWLTWSADEVVVRRLTDPAILPQFLGEALATPRS